MDPRSKSKQNLFRQLTIWSAVITVLYTVIKLIFDVPLFPIIVGCVATTYLVCVWLFWNSAVSLSESRMMALYALEVYGKPVVVRGRYKSIRVEKKVEGGYAVPGESEKVFEYAAAALLCAEELLVTVNGYFVSDSVC